MEIYGLEWSPKSFNRLLATILAKTSDLKYQRVLSYNKAVVN